MTRRSAVPPCLDERPVVLIYRSPLFNASETFVQAHAAGLIRYQPLLTGLEGDARKASQRLDRVGDLGGAAESVTRRVDGASKVAYATISNPVVKVLAVGHGVGRVSRKRRGKPVPTHRFTEPVA